MTPDEVQQRIESALPGSQAMVEGDGHHFSAIVIAEVFENLSRVKQQQCVYQALENQIRSGELHAISLKTYTPATWAAQQG